MIYFDSEKKAYSFEISNPIAMVEEDLWEKYAGTDKWDIIDGVFVDISKSEDYLQKQAEKEQSRIQELSMTRSDFFDGIIKAFGLGQNELQHAIEAVLSLSDISDIQKKVALNNYCNALNFYRKHDLFTRLSGVTIPVSEDLSITINSQQWDKFFDETNKRNAEAYKELLPTKEDTDNECL